MSVTTTASKMAWSGDGSTLEFFIGSPAWKFFAKSDIKVYLRNELTGAETPLVINTHYTIPYTATDGYFDNAKVHMIVAPTTDEQLIIWRDIPKTQSLVLIDNDSLPAKEVEKAFDKLTMMVQSLSQRIDACTRLSDGFYSGFSPILPQPIEADRTLIVNPTGDGFEWGISLGEITASLAAAADSAAAALVSQGAAATSATAAATSATAAAGQVTLATAQVALATAQVALATTQAGNAATSATASATSATAAAASATAAAGSVTSWHSIAATLTNKTIDAASNTVTGLVNANIAAGAAIAYSKLALTGSILNADVSASAAIAYSKLALTGAIVNADIAAGAAIATSKLAAATAIGYVDVGSSLTSLLAAKAPLASPQLTGVASIADTSATVTATQLVLEGRYNAYGAGLRMGSRTSSGGTYVDMARITATGDDAWNTTASTQDARIGISTAVNGALVERYQISSVNGHTWYGTAGTSHGSLNDSGRWTFGAVSGAEEHIIYGKVSQTFPTAGSTARYQVYHSNNSNGASHAVLMANSGGASGGDALSQYVIDGVQTWSAGIDNSDSDKFKISAGAALGTSDVLAITTAGAWTIGPTNGTMGHNLNGSLQFVAPAASESSIYRSQTDGYLQVYGGNSGTTGASIRLYGSTEGSGWANYVRFLGAGGAEFMYGGTGGVTVQAPLTVTSHLEIAEQASPSTPGSGYGRIYFKSDGQAYAKNDGGTEYALGTNSNARSSLTAVGQQVSSTCSEVWSTSTTYADVTNLSVTITTTGRPVMIMLVADGSSSEGSFAVVGNTAAGQGMRVRFLRGATEIATSRFGDAAASGGTIFVPSSSFSHVDVVAAGTYTYKLQQRLVTAATGSGQCGVVYTKLVAFEIA